MVVTSHVITIDKDGILYTLSIDGATFVPTKAQVTIMITSILDPPAHTTVLHNTDTVGK